MSDLIATPLAAEDRTRLDQAAGLEDPIVRRHALLSLRRAFVTEENLEGAIQAQMALVTW